MDARRVTLPAASPPIVVRPERGALFASWPRLVARLVLLLGPAAVLLPAADWREDYEVADGFRLQRDAAGFSLPTAIAFVPHPGLGPKDPLYFVTELRGRLMVVTNDRTVLTFAEGFAPLIPQRELPDHLGEIGLAGLCLDPDTGSVFVTYAYEDEHHIYRNAITRFDTTPGTFATQPVRQQRLAPVLDGFVSNLAHQIGPITIVDGILFVNIGDSMSAIQARDVDFPSGKVLRLTRDGAPLADNPFAVDTDPQKIRNYVWALGFRNPFSLCAVNGRLFAAENGLDLDRFVEVRRGGDYLYGGDADASGANAYYVWSPAVSPVQLAYDVAGRGTAGFPPEWREKFFVALSGSPTDAPGPDHRRKAIVALGVDFAKNQLSQTPRRLLRYAGDGRQLIVGVAVGPDGLYVAAMLPDAEGVTAILHLDYQPQAAHPRPPPKAVTALQIIETRKCLACHRVDGRGLGSAAPELSRLRLADEILVRISGPDYRAQLDEIDRQHTEPFVNYRAARQAVRQAEGIEKARQWIKYRILEPRFDRAVVAMPNLGVTEQEAEVLATWLVAPSAGEHVKLRLQPFLGKEAKRTLTLFTAGAATGLILAVIPFAWWSRRRNRLGAASRPKVLDANADRR